MPYVRSGAQATEEEDTNSLHVSTYVHAVTGT